VVGKNSPKGDSITPKALPRSIPQKACVELKEPGHCPGVAQPPASKGAAGSGRADGPLVAGLEATTGAQPRKRGGGNDEKSSKTMITQVRAVTDCHLKLPWQCTGFTGSHFGELFVWLYSHWGQMPEKKLIEWSLSIFKKHQKLKEKTQIPTPTQTNRRIDKHYTQCMDSKSSPFTFRHEGNRFHRQKKTSDKTVRKSTISEQKRTKKS